ncbi:MAG: hypothetical protein WKF35_06085 [Ferruginibacter sp.]
MQRVVNYFKAEKLESAIFVVVGIIAVVISIYFLVKLQQPYYNGMAYALIAIALLQLTVGASVYLRSDKDIARVNQMIASNPDQISTIEKPGMEVVMKKFVLYRWIEIAQIITGIILFFSFQHGSSWKGLGLGMMITGGLMLLFDLVAEKRGHTYLAFLQNFINGQ